VDKKSHQTDSAQASDSSAPSSPFAGFPDYFAMLNAMAGPLTQVAAAFTSKAATDAAADAASRVMPSFDPEEIEKKIRDLEIVLVWLRAQVGAVEISVKTLEMQRDFLRAMKSEPAKTETPSHEPASDAVRDSVRDSVSAAASVAGAAASSAMQQFGELTSALNPAKWADKMVAARGKKNSASKKKTKPIASKKRRTTR
jgi:hypothetical protein